MTHGTPERRESYRLPDLSKAVCSLIDGDARIDGSLRDVSLTGFFFETGGHPEVSREYTIEIVLEGRHSRLVVDGLHGVVIRSDAAGAAVEFTEKFEWLILAPIFYQEK